MLVDVLQDRAALYVSGAMAAPERDDFELILEFHGGLRALVAELQNATTAWTIAELPPTLAAPTGLMSRILGTLDTQPAPPPPEAVAVTDPAGLIEWVNPAFSAMCGYTLGELRGRKPGALLQGPATDPAAVSRIRQSVREGRACRETLINYHKDGSPYRVAIQIAPVLDDDQGPLWFVARERILAESA